MAQPTSGLHHVTAIASDPQRILDFYVEVLGLRFVKRTVNFDDPGSYHLYLGDDAGTPGTILTFFAWPGATRGSLGLGETSAVAFRIPEASLDFWEQRLLSAGVPAERADDRFGEPVLSFGDPDGMRVEMIGTNETHDYKVPRTSGVPQEHVIRGFHGVTLCEAGFELTGRLLEKMGFRNAAQEQNRIRFVADGLGPGRFIDVRVQPQLIYGNMGAGTIHHIAFRASDDPAQLEWRQVLAGMSLNVTPVLDRCYFHSIYFREPGGVLFEVATDNPGFMIDEPAESLGGDLKLPPWLEKNRAAIERALPPITMPLHEAHSAHG
jgi:glyoxalase family protein